MKTENKPYRIIIDTNLWISFLIGKVLRGLQNYLYHEKVVVITCKEQIFELTEVLNRSKFKKYISKNQVNEFFDLLDEVSELVEIANMVHLCRDQEDDYLLSLALASNADYLVTGDKDLLELKQIEGTVILHFSAFEKIFVS